MGADGPSTDLNSQPRAVSNGGAGMFPRGFAPDTEFAWPLVRANQMVTLAYGKALIEKSRTPGSIPVYGTNGPCGSHSHPLAKGPGLIFGRKGMGPLGVEWTDSDFWVIDTAYFASPVSDDVDLKFVYYLVKYVGLNHLKDGTSNPSLSRDTFYAQLLPKPPLREQRRIAAILGALDDKIELNRRMNATLEAMARALFKSWFVDFDPVRAKAEGRQPAGMDAATAALFPDSFEDSALGPIPGGWQVVPIADILTLHRGFDLPTQDRLPGRVPIISSSGLSGTHSEAKAKGPGVITGRYGTIGKVFYTREDYWPLNTTLFVSDFKEAAPLFVYRMVGSLDFGAYSDKSSVPGINRNHVHQTRVVLPPRSVQHAFQCMGDDWSLLSAANDRSNLTLSAIRDALLPKLVSGEIRVGAAEAIAAAAAAAEALEAASRD